MNDADNGQRCFQWFKDTNLKANHNLVTDMVKLR